MRSASFKSNPHHSARQSQTFCAGREFRLISLEKVCAILPTTRATDPTRLTPAVLPGEMLALPFAYRVAPTWVILPGKPRRGAEGESPQNEPRREEDRV